MPGPRTPTAEPSRVVPGVLSLLRERGVDPSPILRACELPEDAQVARAWPVTPDQFERLIGRAAEALADPQLALRLPAVLRFPDYHVAELAAETSATLGDALERVARYGSLFYAHLAFTCQRAGDELVLAQRLRTGGATSRFGNEYAVASTKHHLERMSGASVEVTRVFFAHPAVPGLAELRAHFGTRDIVFGEPTSGLAIPLTVAARPCLAHDPRLLATAERLSEAALSAQPASGDLVAAAAQAVEGLLAGGAPEAAVVAKRLHLSTRTLQRRLAEAGTCYSDVVDASRRAVALAALRDPRLPLREVAARAGFADTASFGRAFRRWFGESPGGYRKRSLG